MNGQSTFPEMQVAPVMAFDHEYVRQFRAQDYVRLPGSINATDPARAAGDQGRFAGETEWIKNGGHCAFD